ncbi:uncharacterized protein [Equus przewalskii]|uniref:Uncharacterized protein isoform X3 n=1 Tax=Equus przewalskii TaxID=9798 RepID=A0ABM2EID0_EQUPR|nr:uncharacterized protein LOC111767807 isoform X1 [Equus caballus]
MDRSPRAAPRGTLESPTSLVPSPFVHSTSHPTSRTPQKSCEAELRVSSSQSLLEEEDPAPLSQQLQATCASGREPLHHLDLPPASLVAVEYLPFYRTHGQLLAEDESALQPRVCRPQAADPSIGEVPLPEDSEPNGGFFPHYRSKEEHFPSLALPGRSCGGSQDPPTRSEAQAGCFCRTTVSCGCSVALAGPDLASGSSHCPVHCPLLLVSAGCSSDGGLDAPLSSDTAFGGCALCAPGFVPYYRSPEEGLHTSPGPPTSPSGGQEPPRPRAATL